MDPTLTGLLQAATILLILAATTLREWSARTLGNQQNKTLAKQDEALDTIHLLVNSRYLRLLQSFSIAMNRIALLTGDEDDAAAAKLVRDEYDGEAAKQNMVSK